MKSHFQNNLWFIKLKVRLRFWFWDHFTKAGRRWLRSIKK